MRISKLEKWIGLAEITPGTNPEHPLAMSHDYIYSATELEIAYRIRSEKEWQEKSLRSRSASRCL